MQAHTLIFNDECVACSTIAQLICAKAPDIAKVSFYSPKAQILLRRHFPQGWKFRPYLIAGHGDDEKVLSSTALFWTVARLLGPVGMIKAGKAWLRRTRRNKVRGGWAAGPDEKMRGYTPASLADAAAYAGEPLLLPDAEQPGLHRERLIQWYNMHGAFQTASYWKYGETGALVLEQVHRASALPKVDGVAAETVDLGNGLSGHCYTALAADGTHTMITLIVAHADARWLCFRATGIDRDTLLAIARSCNPVRPDAAGR